MDGVNMEEIVSELLDVPFIRCDCDTPDPDMSSYEPELRCYPCRRCGWAVTQERIMNDEGLI